MALEPDNDATLLSEESTSKFMPFSPAYHFDPDSNLSAFKSRFLLHAPSFLSLAATFTGQFTFSYFHDGLVDKYEI